MKRSHRIGGFAAVLAAAMLQTACGQDGTVSVGTVGDAGSEPTATQPAPSGPATVVTEPVTSTSPSTGSVETNDLTDPAAWIGRQFAHSTMFDPFAAVTLDGAPTGWIGGTEQCDFAQSPPPCLGFVRVDPGGYGHSETEPTTWLVISWRAAEGDSTTGTVVDALQFATTSESMWPFGNCGLADGGPAVGLVQHDDAYVPTGDQDVDNAAHPVIRGWTIDSSLAIVETQPDDVTCRLYEYGD